MPADDDDLVPISALQHYLFCPRQCALIHVEQLWTENAATMEGQLMHQSVDSGIGELRSGVRIARGISLLSTRLRLAGRADAVEFRAQPLSAFPVEYKRGKPKLHRADEVQLCAQALCLEEMLGIVVADGALFYGENRRRQHVVFDAELRALTVRIAEETYAMLKAGVTPLARFSTSCKRCSMESLCQPKRFQSPPQVKSWFASRLERALRDDA